LRYVQRMGPRSRIIGYGGSLALVLIGALVAVLRTDSLGMGGAVALISVGLVLATSLVFYEVGLCEDRERARESAAVRAAVDPADEPPPREPARRLVRPGRTRGPK
jgi:Flp pilus assembly protein TadB